MEHILADTDSAFLSLQSPGCTCLHEINQVLSNEFSSLLQLTKVSFHNLQP